jgi:hypothetical protein
METTTAKPTTILDYIDGISVPGRVFENAANEYGMLVCFHVGMESLYGFAKQCDSSISNGNSPGRYILGAPPGFPTPLLVSAFHWYAMSAYQYALIVGAIAYRNDNSRPKPDEYVQSVMPEIFVFRNKSAAHTAWAKPHRNDTEAERFASIVPLPQFAYGSWHMGAKVVVGEGPDQHTSKRIKLWSISKTHEQLRQRYWHDDQIRGATLAIQLAGEGLIVPPGCCEL